MSEDDKSITTLGSWLKHWRESKKGALDFFTQPDIARELKERFPAGWSQSTLSKVERDLHDFQGEWEGWRLYVLLQAYRVPVTLMLELAERFNLPRLSQYIAEEKHVYRVQEGPRVRYRGKIAAGQLTDSFVDDEPVTIGGVPDWIVERFPLDDVFAVEVNGKSMMSPEAAEAIPDGSMVFLHAKGRPHNGDIICAYLPAHDQTILKRWTEGVAYAVLSSSNPEHPPIVVAGDEQVLLQGVYLTHTPRPRRFR